MRQVRRYGIGDLGRHVWPRPVRRYQTGQRGGSSPPPVHLSTSPLRNGALGRDTGYVAPACQTGEEDGSHIFSPSNDTVGRPHVPPHCNFTISIAYLGEPAALFQGLRAKKAELYSKLRVCRLGMVFKAPVLKPLELIGPPSAITVLFMRYLGANRQGTARRGCVGSRQNSAAIAWW